MPRSNTLPSMISASTRFLAQPRLIIPTFGRCSGGRAARWGYGIAADTAAATEEFFAGLTAL